MIVVRWASGVALLWALATCAASAQQVDEARRLFEAGQQAHTEGRFADARDLFSESLEQAPRPSTAWNLSLTLRATGFDGEALEVVQRLLGGRYGTVDPALRADAERLAGELQQRVATVRVAVESDGPVPISVDGRVRGSSSRVTPLDVAVSSGQHRLEAALPEGSVSRSVELDPGEHRSLDLVADGDSLFESPLFWAVGVAAVIAVITVGVVVTTGGSEPLEEDPVFGNTEVLSF